MSAVKQSRSEERVKSDIKKRLTTWRAWHFCPPGNGYGRSGIPDHIGCVPVEVTEEMIGKTVGLFVAVEAKAEGRRKEKDQGLSAHQIKEINAIRAASGLVVRADCVEDLEPVEDAIGYERKK